MSIVLSRILAQSATMYPATVALSPESVTVLLYGVQFLENRRNWLDLQDDPLDEITDADWDEIEELVANLVQEVYNPMIGYCFPIVLGGIPDNCLPLEGGIYDREDYPILYDLLDGAFVLSPDTFTLPDFRSRVPIGAGEGTGLSEYSIGQTGGEETHSLTDDENGSHSHIDAGHTHVYQPPGATGVAVAPGELPVLLPALLPTNTLTGNASISSSGSGAPHNNIQPFVAVRWAVIAQ